ncbi:hypothetical protein G6F62_015713 [Rhizopus arrhizus]|nr:hypothetical protein G6F62_015713 [Rhizopus arrhizus]
MAGTQRGGAAGLFDGFGRTRQAGTGHDRDAAADALDRAGQQQVVLGIDAAGAANRRDRGRRRPGTGSPAR